MNTPQYVTCRCQHCDGGIEFDANELAVENSIVPCPHCGLQTKLFKPSLPVRLTAPAPRVRLPEVQIPLAYDPPPRPLASMMIVKQRLHLQMANLTEMDIKKNTPTRGNAVHRAAKNGVIPGIPSHLLTPELFIVKDGAGATPLQVAARNGYLHQVPSIFLTAETLSVWDHSGETPLHIAARCGQLCLVPRILFTPALLALRTQNQSASTVLHFMAAANQMDLIPGDCFTPDIWTLKSGDGSTPRDILDRAFAVLSEKNKANPWRCDAATEKQKDKLSFFGCTWDEGITKGQASDAIDACVIAFPDSAEAYYTRPATEEQREKLRLYGKNPDERWGKPRRKTLTYGEAKDWLGDCFLSRRVRSERKFLNECDRAERRMRPDRL
jgi:hypothetical protein